MREFEHLTLARTLVPTPRRRPQGGGRPIRREDRPAHAAGLVRQVDALVADFETHAEDLRDQGIDPTLVFRLSIHPGKTLDDAVLAGLRLRVLARDPQGAIVVFPDQPTLTELRRHIDEYGADEAGRRFANMSVIDSISALGPDDRIGPRLRAEPIREGESAFLDVELFHRGRHDEATQDLNEIRVWIEHRNARLTDHIITSDAILARVNLSAAVAEELLELPIVREVDRRPRPSFELGDIAVLGAEALEPRVDLDEDAPGVVVVDSGISQLHPLLGPLLGDAQVFPDRLRTRVAGGPEDGDNAYRGHGTGVAGIAAYDDIGRCLEAREFVAHVRLFSARVTDENNEYDEESLVETQLGGAVQYFLDNYPAAKVFNISLGDRHAILADSQRQFRFAAAIDRLAYEHRDREVVFVVSAGNIHPEDVLPREDVFASYPQYLLDSPRARIVDPASSALGVTVGGLAYGLATPYGGDQGRVVRAVAGERDWPSPFTRVGPGFGEAIKPEFVAYAGDMAQVGGGIREIAESGIPTTNRDWAGGQLLRTVIGTSFAAPRVANMAARLFGEFPGISSNLVRALLAVSASPPSAKPPALQHLAAYDRDSLRIYGYGIPDYDRARWSAHNEVFFVEEGSIGVDQVQLYLVPEIPPEMLAASGTRTLKVALAFDPPTRATRADSYLGIAMDFALFRNTPPTDVLNAIREWSREEREALQEAPLPNREGLGSAAIELRPGSLTRQRGTLQLASFSFRTRGWRYDEGPLVLALVAKRRWAPDAVTTQRFGVVVSLSHESEDVDLYTRLAARSRAYARARTRVQIGGGRMRTGSGQLNLDL